MGKQTSMSAAEARRVFDSAIAAADPGQVAKLELAREYFCNPSFRAALADHVYALNTAQGGAA